MNRYQSSIPRAAFGIAAVATTALTLGLAVILPATTMSAERPARPSAVARAETAVRPEVAILPMRIDVVGEREQNTALDRVPQAPRKHKQAG